MNASYASGWSDARIAAWRRRGLDLWGALGSDLAHFVSTSAVEALLEALIHPDNPACHDASNAAHMMAQNDNLVVLARWADAPADVVATALAAGLIHDLNKAPHEPLRRDGYAVRTSEGALVEHMASEPIVVGLNHYGERTRATLQRLVEAGQLAEPMAAGIDRCIVHHGFGSSRFIRALVEGKVSWGRADFLDENARPRFRLPVQPRPTLATVLHDLADSAQQMQAGVAWVSKYPMGYWKDTGASWAELLSGDAESGNVPTGLSGQLRTELETCQSILRQAIEFNIVNRALALRLERGVEALVAAGRSWVDERPETLGLPHGETVYHHLAQSMGGSASATRAHLLGVRPGEEPALDARIIKAAHALDEARALQLHTAVRKHVPAPAAVPRDER